MKWIHRIFILRTVIKKAAGITAGFFIPALIYAENLMNLILLPMMKVFIN